MKKLLLAGVSLATIGMISGASAADAYMPVKANPCINGGDPYKNYSCLDPYLGLDFMTRLVSCQRAAESPQLWARNFPHLAGWRSAVGVIGNSIFGWSAAPLRLCRSGRWLDEGVRTDVFGNEIGVLAKAVA
jgi:hypothetical protein